MKIVLLRQPSLAGRSVGRVKQIGVIGDCRLVGALSYFWFASTYALDWVHAAQSTDLVGLMPKTRTEVRICAVLHDSALTRAESIELARQAHLFYILVKCDQDQRYMSHQLKFRPELPTTSRVSPRPGGTRKD